MRSYNGVVKRNVGEKKNYVRSYNGVVRRNVGEKKNYCWRELDLRCYVGVLSCGSGLS